MNKLAEEHAKGPRVRKQLGHLRKEEKIWAKSDLFPAGCCTASQPNESIWRWHESRSKEIWCDLHLYGATRRMVAWRVCLLRVTQCIRPLKGGLYRLLLFYVFLSFSGYDDGNMPCSFHIETRAPLQLCSTAELYRVAVLCSSSSSREKRFFFVLLRI